jgi:hypothetical protein
MVTGGGRFVGSKAKAQGFPEILPPVRHVLQPDHAGNGIARSGRDKGATQGLFGRLLFRFCFDDFDTNRAACLGILAGDVAEHSQRLARLQ